MSESDDRTIGELLDKVRKLEHDVQLQKHIAANWKARALEAERNMKSISDSVATLAKMLKKRMPGMWEGDNTP